MDWIQALILGLVQGLTEYLPVSSSGHLTIGAALFGLNGEENLAFNITVHVATVMSTLVVLGNTVKRLLVDACHPLQKGEGSIIARLNPAQYYLLAIVVSMIPIGIVGAFFKDKVEELFGSGLLIVGICLLVTATLLIFSYVYRPRQRERISLGHAFVIGLAQAVAILPGLSRSGSTIATGLLLGNRKDTMAQFSFLMVIPPILGEALLDGLKLASGEATGGFATISPLVLLVGFLAAFAAGVAACRWMLSIVRNGKLIYFAYYCIAVGVLTLLTYFFVF